MKQVFSIKRLMFKIEMSKNNLTHTTLLPKKSHIYLRTNAFYKLLELDFAYI